MKRMLIITMAAGAVLAGCATGGTALRTAVGPDPAGAKTDNANGVLEVFSAKEKVNDVGYAFPHSERTDYYVYDSSGNEVKAVHDNNKGEFESTPRPIQLAPGNYKVRALAAVGLGEWVSVPVVVSAGKTTEVHLNGQWKGPDNTPGSDLVFSPGGFPMGWRANP